MTFIQIWLLPFALLATATILAFPLSRYMAWIMDGKYRPLRILAWFEKRLDSGEQNWKQYLFALLLFNALMYVYTFLILALQPYTPLNPRGLTMIAPSTIFDTVVSFITNTNLQHYSGEQHLSNFTQVFFGIFNLFFSAAVGLCALVAIIRALRGQSTVGNFFIDMWRVVVYIFVPAALILGLIFITQGSPMTFKTSYDIQTLESGAMGTTDTGEAKPQTIVVGPVAAWESMKMLGTNGGGFYGMNSAHPFENPTGFSNFFNTYWYDDVSIWPGAHVWPNAQQVQTLARDFLGHDGHDGRDDRLGDLFRYAETESGLDRPIRGRKVRCCICGGSGRKPHRYSAGLAGPARGPASGQS